MIYSGSGFESPISGSGSRQNYNSGSGSRQKVRIHADPDPKHCLLENFLKASVAEPVLVGAEIFWLESEFLVGFSSGHFLIRTFSN